MYYNEHLNEKEFRDYFRYKLQQTQLNKIADELGVVAYRPDYHGNHDPNTVLFYTKEDHVHNLKVDALERQGWPVFTKSDRSRCPFPVEDKYVYRDYFWWFENTDANGCYTYQFANFGKIDLRDLREDTLEGAVRFEYAKKKKNDYVRSVGGILNLTEADETYNDFNREMIDAFKMIHKKCYLGNVNVYGDKPEKLIEEYTGQKIYNFSYSFCIPKHDEQLEKLIRDWNDTGNANLVDEITDRIEKIGGFNLIWF